MNIRLCILGAVAVLATALSGLAETVYLVEISDMRKADAWEIMTREEVAKLQKEIQEETRVFPAALAAAKKAWDERRAGRGVRLVGLHVTLLDPQLERQLVLGL